MDAAAIEAGDENWTSAGDLVRLLRALAVPGQLPDDVRLPVLDALAVSQHLDVLGEVVPEDQLLGVKAGSHERALHDTGLVGPPGVANWPRGVLLANRRRDLANWPRGPLAVAICSSPPASKDALRATARAVLEPSSARGCGARRPRCCRSCRGSAPAQRTGPPAPGTGSSTVPFVACSGSTTVCLPSVAQTVTYGDLASRTDHRTWIRWRAPRPTPTPRRSAATCPGARRPAPAAAGLERLPAMSTPTTWTV